MKTFIHLLTVNGVTIFINAEEIESIEYIEGDEEGDRTTINMKSGKFYITESLAEEIFEILNLKIKSPKGEI